MLSFHDQMTTELRQAIAELQKSVQSLISACPVVPRLPSPFGANTAPGQSINELLAPLVETFGHVAAAFGEAKALDDAGWLPHRTIPLGLVASHVAEPDRLGAEIEAFCQANWTAIRTELALDCAAYAVDQDIKDAYLEGISCHEAGLYRATISLMFVTIERAARSAFNNGLPGKVSTATGRQGVIEMLTKMAEEHAKDGLPAFHMLVAFQRFTDHVYANVHDSSAVQNVAQSPVPNRHAAVHGLLGYNTYANSLNSIFLADYAFAIIDGFRSGASSRNAAGGGLKP